MISKQISRRSFLKGGFAGAAALGISRLPVPASVKGADPKELATLIDIRKCIGCEACVEACQETNASKFPEPVKPFPKMFPERVKAEDWSDKRDVSSRLTPYNWVFIQEASVKENGHKETYTFPRRCMHCQNPPCADLCPWGAARKLKNGITRIDSHLCLGGQKCKVVCPWHIPERQTGVGLYLDVMPSFAGNGVMFKCDRCYDRIEKGLLPACIEACPENVQTIGPREEILKEAHRIAAEINGYIYGEKENGGTNTIYVSPVPFDKLNEAVEKGPGRPHFKPVEDAMANADNLAKAMIIAPVVGIAAAIVRFLRISK
ncbi:MAG TPA: 4Fe-4S dicluster domain-containing protein [Desulfobacteraceae bacterium]|nr:4Fe-4S dicluster domain-containing protein [Desulfobacteraceae bacterium]HPJ68045.1 4Fe-4S dicluster domain-containing protein [Desulfobacteraceae bacterium]HPQ28386.1 4Fe-4S dicluster domain-containing protein [Desulfobacteraceae bacterium]